MLVEYGPWCAAHQATFLKELRKRGNVSASADATGVGRRTVYQWRDSHPEFAAAWDDAINYAFDHAEGEAYRRAVEGFPGRPVMRRTGKDSPDEVVAMTEYSDGLLTLLLKAYRPERYRERLDIGTGPGQGPLVDLSKLSAKDAGSVLTTLRTALPDLEEGKIIEAERVA